MPLIYYSQIVRTVMGGVGSATEAPFTRSNPDYFEPGWNAR